jgi:SAM-dependent methyltransferase
MNRAHEQLVDAQFGPRAKAYVESAVHARGPDLEALESVVSGVRPARALDLGTGGGHVAYLMARHAGAVTASDLSREMLAAVAAAAKERGLSNVEVAEASAERMKFENEWFDFLGCRYSAHHWRNLEAGRSARGTTGPQARLQSCVHRRLRAGGRRARHPPPGGRTAPRHLACSGLHKLGMDRRAQPLGFCVADFQIVAHSHRLSDLDCPDANAAG